MKQKSCRGNPHSRNDLTVNTYDVTISFSGQVAQLGSGYHLISGPNTWRQRKFQIHHPVIQGCCNCCGNWKESVLDLRKMLRLPSSPILVLWDDRRVEHSPDLCWPAATVPVRNTRSCSFRCAGRRASLPVMVDRCRKGEAASMDDVFHRWWDLFTGYGWIRWIQARRQRLARNQAMAIRGISSRRFLITTQSGGGSETMEWTYNSKPGLHDRTEDPCEFRALRDWRNG